MKVEVPDDWPIEIIESTGQPMDGCLRLVIGKFCKVLACAYGSTEHCLGPTTQLINQAEFREFNCGHLVPMNGLEMKVVDKDGNIVPVDRRGELMVRGPGMFKEYLNNPERTMAVKSADGWFKTDDLARIDEYGRIYIEGRISNVIVSKGDNVVPEVMEASFKKCSGIRDVVIVPVPDPACFQLLCACILKEAGQSLTEEDVREFARRFYNQESEMIALLPTFYMFLESFPKTSTGKKSRKKLQTMAAQTFNKNNNFITVNRTGTS